MNREFELLFSLMEEKRYAQLCSVLAEQNEVDVAAFIGLLPAEAAARIFRLLYKEQASEVFANLEPKMQEIIISVISDLELRTIIEELYVDDAVDMLEELPANMVKRVLRSAASNTRDLINQYLQYPENSAGSIMTAEFIDLKQDMNVLTAIERIRKIGENSEQIYTCYVIDHNRILEGVVTV